MLYQYKPLREDEVRLLVLEPASSHADTAVICSLVHTSLDNEPAYEALSYVWGDPDNVTSVTCSSREVNVTVNLHSAIRHLRYTNKPRVLWADAICIDQRNLKERNQQVRLMAKIYKQAAQVLIWLDEESEDLKSCSESVRTAYSLFPPLDITTVDRSDARQLMSNYSRTLTRGSKSTVFDYNWRPLVCLLRRPWFRRKWVAQEIAHARKAVLICGDVTWDWKEFRDLIRTIGFYGLLVQFANILEENGAHEPIRVLINVAFMTDLQGRERGAGGSMVRLLELLLATRNFQCLDPRDHVIGVLSLAEDVNLEDDEIAPDYEVSTEVFYKRVAAWTIVKQESLQILSFVSSAPEPCLQSLPSWVPHFGQLSSPLVAFEDTHFRACGSLCRHGAFISYDNSVLHVSGLVVDKVRALARSPIDLPLGSEDSISSILTRALSNFSLPKLLRERGWVRECQALASYSSLSLSSDERTEAFCRTMLCDLVGGAKPAPAEYSRYFANFLEFIDDVLGEKHEDWPETMMTSVTAVEASLAAYSGNRQFCITKEGMMAQVPRGTHIGDLICVFRGGKVPFVLRGKRYERFTLLGDCYVHGIMNGEAVEGKESLMREFVIL
jgi:hypothetical protein